MLIKNKRAAAAFGILVLLAVFAITYSYLSQPNQPPYHKPESGTTKESVQDISAETVAYYTEVLAWFTGLLAVVSVFQGIILIRADRTASRNADAAHISASAAQKALTELERPWLFLQGATVGYRPVNVANAWEIKLHFFNVGRSPAIIETCIFSVVGRRIATDVPDYNKCTDTVGCVKTLAATGDFFTEKIGLDPSCYIDIDYVLYGKLIYKELNGTKHVSGFGIIPARVQPSDPGERPFNTYGDEAYNYYT